MANLSLNFCRCCLNEEKSTQKFLDMKNESIFFKNRRSTFYESYFEISGCSLEDFLEIPVVQCKICPQCLVTLKTAYVFRQVCQETSGYLKKQFADDCLNTEAVPMMLTDSIVGEIKDEPEINIEAEPEMIVDDYVNLSTGATGYGILEESSLVTISADSHFKVCTGGRVKTIRKRSGTFKCDHCNENKLTKKDLSEHLRVEHFNETTLQSLSPVVVKKPARKKVQPTTTTTTPITPTITITGMGQQKKYRYGCPLCNHHTTSKDMITNHILGHTRNMGTNFYCKLCCEAFQNAALFKDHVAKRHLKRK